MPRSDAATFVVRAGTRGSCATSTGYRPSSRHRGPNAHCVPSSDSKSSGPNARPFTRNARETRWPARRSEREVLRSWSARYRRECCQCAHARTPRQFCRQRIALTRRTARRMSHACVAAVGVEADDKTLNARKRASLPRLCRSASRTAGRDAKAPTIEPRHHCAPLRVRARQLYARELGRTPSRKGSNTGNEREARAQGERESPDGERAPGTCRPRCSSSMARPGAMAAAPSLAI